MSARVNRSASIVLCLAALAALAGCGGGSSSQPATPTPTGGTPPIDTTPVSAARELWTPYVIPEHRTEPVLYEVLTTGRPSSVSLAIGSTTLALNDKGAGGDKFAGDGTWSVQIPAATIIARNTSDRVNRPYVGALRLSGSSAVYNVFAEVWTAALGTSIPSAIPGGQETGHVVSYLATTEQLTRFDPAAWARTFYESHPDQYDFLNFVLVGGVRDNRHHSVVRNAVSGIGLGAIHAGASYGSAGKLQGINVFPISSLMDHGGKGFLHETAHQWLSYLPLAPFGAASPHWPKGSVASGIMGFSIPPSGQGGDFPFSFTPDGKGGYLTALQEPSERTRFNLLELYMMGLAGADEVPGYFVLKNQSLSVAPGQQLTADDIQIVKVADIVAAVGPRSPAVGSAQKDFRSATIILSERPLDTYALSLYDHFARRGEARTELPCAEGLAGGLRCKPWYLATGGRSTMSMRIR